MNETKLLCLRCPSVIFRPNAATLVVSNQYILPSLKTKDEFEDIKQFWAVSDMMAFENIGFSRDAPDGIKFLVCADCELGPLGYHDPKEIPLIYRIAVERTLNIVV